MGRGHQSPQTIAIPSTVRSGIRVSLFGGPADGRLVRVQFVEDPVAIYMTRAGELIALAADAPVPAGQFLGFYEFAGSRGPERPVLVHRVGARRRRAR